MAATDTELRLYSYVVRYDYGFAPNPFHGWCTLATCKPRIRCSARVGDWVVGTGSVARGLAGRLVYAMRVDELLSLDQYWHDPRFQDKKPDLAGSLRYRYGDNIYRRSSRGQWIQADSRHSLASGRPNDKHIARDTGCDRVLLSQHFSYFGGAGPRIPQRLRDWDGIDICLPGVGYQWRTIPVALRKATIRWLSSLGAGQQGDPADW